MFLLDRLRPPTADRRPLNGSTVNGDIGDDAKYYDIEMGPEVPMTVQDRAYTSPIWHTPKS